MQYFTVALIILAVVIAVRLGWVMVHNIAARWLWALFLSHQENHDEPPPGPRSGIAIGWSGMRGIVTLAAAMALPADFPYRDFMQLTAFTVVLGTLVLQGLTLGPLFKALRLPEDNTIEAEIELSRSSVTQAALTALEGIETPASRQLKAEYAEVLARTQAGGPARSREDVDLRTRTAIAARQEPSLTP